MVPFLKELAEKMIGQYPRLDQMTFVFPNRRAALYFQNYLALSLTRPQWAPHLYSIEEYFKQHSDLKEPDRLTLIYQLYKVYAEVLKNTETFDRFYFWGEMLLRDFDELDKYLINASQLFKDLSSLKELDETFDYLTEEQRAFLKEFWIHFEEKPSLTKEEFLRMWRNLPKVYSEYTKALKKEGLGYEGMIHRDVAESCLKKSPVVSADHPVIFAGFNALTKAEEILISKMVEQGARIFWDLDSYYVDNDLQEAGQFMRQYRKHSSFRKTFDARLPSYLLTGKKCIHLTGVPQRIGQAKLAGDKTKEIVMALPKENQAAELSKTVIVLPDEAMLLPVMHSLPRELDDINVTMGFPLRHTPLFNLLDQVVEMQVKRRKNSFSHREVNAILGHAYFLTLAEKDAQHLQDEIIAKNKVYVSSDDLRGTDPVFQIIFRPVEPAAATTYLLDLIRYLGARFSDKRTFDREYAYHFHQHISRLHTILAESDKAPDWRGFQKLFRQVILSQKIPFSGEPLRGLQIMGVLETRNLDFDNVIIISLNEGLLPAASRQGSYIPHTIRKAYGLPTYEHQDAIYAYLFYRLLQRANNIHFYYNTEPDVLGNGEMSRYLQQLLLESKLPFEKSILHNPVHIHRAKPIEIPKSEAVIAQLNKYVVNESGDAPYKLSPSNLNDYIDCGLRFYLRHVVGLSEAEEVEEDVDARIFGNIVHKVAGWFYDELRAKRNGQVTSSDFEQPESRIEQLIDRAFREIYYLNENALVVYEGQRVVVKEMAKTFVKRITEMDSFYAPFEITMVEEPFFERIGLSNGTKVKIGGTIDRADHKDGTVRVIDYKTGKVEQHFESIASLFAGGSKRNRAAFQTILYAYIYKLRQGATPVTILPGLLNGKSIFDRTFVFGHTMGKGKILNIWPFLDEFAGHLRQVLEDIYNPDIPFRQTTFEKSCTFCSYKSLCRR